MKKSYWNPSNIKNSIQKELQKPFKPIASIFGAAQEQQEKRNANSIKKILKELTDLKKQLKDIKHYDRSHQQSLDMSVCRKITQQMKSPSPPQRNHSSSRKKATSQTKQISTQTKAKKNQINQFSFSIDSKSAKKPSKPIYQADSESEQSEYSEHSFKKRSNKSTKRFKPSKSIQDLRPINEKITDRVAAIEASELYERYLNNLRHNTDVIELSSAMYTPEDKIKLNIELERLSKNIARIPIYMSKPEQYYDGLQLYARNLNNQLNNMVLTLNRCQERPIKLKQNNNRYQNTNVCKYCDEHEKKGLDRLHRKQIKRYTKELRRYEQQLDYRLTQQKRLKEVVGNLMKQIQKYKEKEVAHKYEEKQWESKFNCQSDKRSDLEKVIQTLEQEKEKQQTKNRLLEDDLNYYKNQVQKFKTDYYEKHNGEKQKETKQHYIELKNKELQMTVAEIRGKESLYQNIIHEKEQLIEQLRSKWNAHQQTFNMTLLSQKKQRKEYSDDQINSEEYHRVKDDLRQKVRKCRSQEEDLVALQNKNRELMSNLEYCVAEIQNLHNQISSLHEANQKYKDKALKARIITEKKGKKQAEADHSRGQAFKEIKDLIKHHQDNLAKEKR